MALASLSAKVVLFYPKMFQLFFGLFFPQVGVVDLDICGPSIPKLMSVENDAVMNGPYGWVPLRCSILCKSHTLSNTHPHIYSLIDACTHSFTHSHTHSSPHEGVKVMSVGNLLETRDSAVVWRGPRKTAMIKRFVKDTFWGRLDYLIFDIPHIEITTHSARIQFVHT